MSQPKKIIKVSTHDDLVAALTTAADEIVVEGDAQLIEQAEKIIAGGHIYKSPESGSLSRHPNFPKPPSPPPYWRPPPKPIVINPTTGLPGNIRGGYDVGGPPYGHFRDSTPRASRSHRGFFLAWVVGAIVVAVLALGSSLLLYRTHWLLAPSPAPPPPQSSVPSPPPVLPKPSPSADGGGVNYVALGWIAAAIIAMFLVYRVIIKAMQAERDVEFSWKVTEKVSGKLVITKIQRTTKVSTPRKPKAA